MSSGAHFTTQVQFAVPNFTLIAGLWDQRIKNVLANLPGNLVKFSSHLHVYELILTVKFCCFLYHS